MRFKSKQKRFGGAALEFAIAGPAFIMLLIAGFEFTRMNLVRHTLINATYAASRHAMVPGATKEEAIEQAEKVLSLVGLKDATITIDPPTIDETTLFVKTSITLPCDKNSVGLSIIFKGREMSAETLMMTERGPLAQANALPTITSPPPPPPQPPPQTRTRADTSRRWR